MENPAHEIKSIIQTLCTRPQAEQEEVIRKYFTPDAEFVHPLCRVPPFKGSDAIARLRAYVPPVRTKLRSRTELNSRQIVMAVFRWYKILSPYIELGIESVAWDRTSNTLFIALHQRFALWFVPMYAANVRLVTELRLEPVADSSDGSASYAAVAAASSGSQGTDGPHTSNSSRGRLVSGEARLHPPQTRYYISRQEDHYQVNELVKFFSLGLGAWLWTWVQLLATLMCVGGVLVVDTTLGLFGGKKKAINKYLDSWTLLKALQNADSSGSDGGREASVGNA